MTWALITIAAAFLQNLRSALQKRLTADLSTAGASFARFAFAAPIALLIAGLVHAVSEGPLPQTDTAFWLYAVAGGLAQILATVALLASFAHGSFAVGTAYSKTESLQAAVVGFLVLGEAINWIAGVGLLIGLVGVILLARSGGSAEPTQSAGGWANPSLVGLAILSGALFAIAAVSYRGASLSLSSGTAVERAVLTLAVVTLFQTCVMALWLRLREPGEISRVISAWRLTAPTALAGVAASACWFTAMTLQQVAYVRALGQVELVFSTLSSVLFFREHVRLVDWLGIALIGASVVLVLIGATVTLP
ncbi:MAG: DMT family transporter [Pseudomonadota bacterium]